MMKIYHRDMACPMCGKPHTLTLYEHDSFYLDGTPAITVEQFLATQALCTDGLFTGEKWYNMR